MLQRKNQQQTEYYYSEHREPKILLVDDDSVVRKMTTNLLEQLHCCVITAENGMEALNQFDDSLDVVLLDLELPDMHGLEICRQLCARPLLVPIPIIAHTSHHEVSIERECYAAGASDFKTKPLSAVEMAELLELWVVDYIAPTITMMEEK